LHSRKYSICYIDRKEYNMRIDAASPQPQKINELLTRQTNEVAGEREHDGDSDDVAKAAAPAASRINPQGVGTKVDLLA
jgi:hypothetical protein